LSRWRRSISLRRFSGCYQMSPLISNQRLEGEAFPYHASQVVIKCHLWSRIIDPKYADFGSFVKAHIMGQELTCFWSRIRDLKAKHFPTTLLRLLSNVTFEIQSMHILLVLWKLTSRDENWHALGGARGPYDARYRILFVILPYHASQVVIKCHLWSRIIDSEYADFGSFCKSSHHGTRIDMLLISYQRFEGEVFPYDASQVVIKCHLWYRIRDSEYADFVSFVKAHIMRRELACFRRGQGLAPYAYDARYHVPFVIRPAGDSLYASERPPRGFDPGSPDWDWAQLSTRASPCPELTCFSKSM
jgi:hypothetical protein